VEHYKELRLVGETQKTITPSLFPTV